LHARLDDDRQQVVAEVRPRGVQHAQLGPRVGLALGDPPVEAAHHHLVQELRVEHRALGGDVAQIQFQHTLAGHEGDRPHPFLLSAVLADLINHPLAVLVPEAVDRFRAGQPA
jgi:hypothetical protein